MKKKKGTSFSFTCFVAVLLLLFGCKKITSEKTVTYTPRIPTPDTIVSPPWSRFLVTPADSLWELKKIQGVSIHASEPLQNAPNQLLLGDRKKKNVYLVPLLNRIGTLYGVDYTLKAAIDSLKTAPGGPFRPATMADYVGMLKEHMPVILRLGHTVACITTLKSAVSGNDIGVVRGGNKSGPTMEVIVNAGYTNATISSGNEVLAVKE